MVLKNIVELTKYKKYTQIQRNYCRVFGISENIYVKQNVDIDYNGNVLKKYIPTKFNKFCSLICTLKFVLDMFRTLHFSYKHISSATFLHVWPFILYNDFYIIICSLVVSQLTQDEESQVQTWACALILK